MFGDVFYIDFIITYAIDSVNAIVIGKDNTAVNLAKPNSVVERS